MFCRLIQLSTIASISKSSQHCLTLVCSGLLWFALVKWPPLFATDRQLPLKALSSHAVAGAKIPFFSGPCALSKSFTQREHNP